MNDLSSKNVLTSLSIDLALGHFDLLPEEIRTQLPPPLPPEKVVTVYGQAIHYYDAGSGPPVIFLHGLGGEAANWTANIGPISRICHAYALDQIGFGLSSKPFLEYRIATFVDFLRGFMQALLIPRATLIGNSLGGWIAVEFAASRPEMVDKLILVSAGGLTPKVRAALPPIDFGRASIGGTRNVLELMFFNKHLITYEVAARAFENHMRRGNGYARQRFLTGLVINNQFVDASLASLRSPALLIWGRNDQLTPLAVGERFEKGIAGAKLAVLNECGHVPQIEKTLEFNDLVCSFL